MIQIQLIGTIEEIQETKNYPKKDGTGNINITKLKIDGKYFTSFDKEQLKDIVVGNKVDVTYTSKDNTYEGKTYTNNNISILKLHVPTPPLSPETQAKVDAVAQTMQQTGTNATDPNFAKNLAVNTIVGVNTINVGDKTFKVTLEEIK